MADWRERMIEEHGLGELQQAWRDMSDEEKAVMKAKVLRMGKNFVRMPTPQPNKAAGHTAHIDPAERLRQLDTIFRAMTPEERESVADSAFVE